MATVDRGTATAPIYKARDMGIPLHVWVDETRPRNQGSQLTAWELKNEEIDHTIIPDNTGGHLMQRRMVDVVITGSDRTTYTGDVCNKIGTYQKLLQPLIIMCLFTWPYRHQRLIGILMMEKIL